MLANARLSHFFSRGVRHLIHATTPKDMKPLSSHLHGSFSYDKPSVNQDKVHPDSSTQSTPMDEFERFLAPIGGAIDLNPDVNSDSSKANKFRAESKLNSCVQFVDGVNKRKYDEEEFSAIKMAADVADSVSSSVGQVSEDNSCAVSFEKPSEEMEVQSSLGNPLDHMSCLQKSLPIKRGLSNFFSGKSQSFITFSNLSSTRELAKAENPYTKKRKLGVPM